MLYSEGWDYYVNNCDNEDLNGYQVVEDVCDSLWFRLVDVQRTDEHEADSNRNLHITFTWWKLYNKQNVLLFTINSLLGLIEAFVHFSKPWNYIRQAYFETWLVNIFETIKRNLFIQYEFGYVQLQRACEIVKSFNKYNCIRSRKNNRNMSTYTPYLSN